MINLRLIVLLILVFLTFIDAKADLQQCRKKDGSILYSNLGCEDATVINTYDLPTKKPEPIQSPANVQPRYLPPRPKGDARSIATSKGGYLIDVAHNDELFIINGEKFEAKTYCFNMNEGDTVIFIEGSALGACASATLINLNTNSKCEVWCN
ncbi:MULTISPECIES: hypothetical protein [Methylomonas]|uniref:DUF4124 domain-containing protein n=1 Tax=Methylomonas methanica TaxID=421 RepID=A0ABY2CMK5_METMH|nr:MULTISPECIES: hypothetical protein [Methylomonas]TCV84377.1 hypothetical protein EDE11_10734 [Methylomonas methanica]